MSNDIKNEIGLTDQICAWMLRGPLAVVLAGLCLLHLECWIPSYLSWPWSPDHDVFATLARSWDDGILPYREMEANNFPTTIYLYWVLGKVFGWGQTWPFFAFDAALVILLGFAMAVWSNARFKAVLPGLVGYLWFLRYYLDLDYSMAGQRDWHASLLATLALMAAEARPGWTGRMISAVTAALAVAVRPQAVLFLPALTLAITTGVRRSDESLGAVVRACLGWATAFVLILALTFVPLLSAGLFGDFMHDFHRAAYGGIHAESTGQALLGRSISALLRWEVVVVTLATLVLTGAAGSLARRSGYTWIAALLASALYKPISPRQHDYLDIPLLVLLAVNLAVILGMILQEVAIPPAIRLSAILLVLGTNAHISPYAKDSSKLQPHAWMGWSFATRDELFNGNPPLNYPDGYWASYPRSDYEAVLSYLQKKIGARTAVANALAYPLALTGPTARLSAFPAESLAWLRYVEPDDEAAFAAKLESTPDSVVVWIPWEFDRGGLAQFDQLEQTIREFYELDERAGAIEIWRRKKRTEHLPDRSPATSFNWLRRDLSM